jgi:pimeloyl-ACP methyl ester carboxylesterase
LGSSRSANTSGRGGFAVRLLRDVVGDYRRKYLPKFARILPDAWFQSAIDDAGWLGGFDPDASEPLRSIVRTAPTLLIHGDADTQVPLRHSRHLEQASAGRAVLAVLPGASPLCLSTPPTPFARGPSLGSMHGCTVTSAKLRPMSGERGGSRSPRTHCVD